MSESKQLEAGMSLVKEFWGGHCYADGLFNFKPKVRGKKCGSLGTSGEDQNMAETMKMTGCRSCKCMLSFSEFLTEFAYAWRVIS